MLDTAEATNSRRFGLQSSSSMMVIVRTPQSSPHDVSMRASIVSEERKLDYRAADLKWQPFFAGSFSESHILRVMPTELGKPYMQQPL